MDFTVKKVLPIDADGGYPPLVRPVCPPPAPRPSLKTESVDIQNIINRYEEIARDVPDAVPDIQAELLMAYAAGASDALRKDLDLDDVCQIVEAAEKLLGGA
jgi:hypothetical protein